LLLFHAPSILSSVVIVFCVKSGLKLVTHDGKHITESAIKKVKTIIFDFNVFIK
jgi:hypothetical protein